MKPNLLKEIFKSVLKCLKIYCYAYRNTCSYECNTAVDITCRTDEQVIAV